MGPFVKLFIDASNVRSFVRLNFCYIGRRLTKAEDNDVILRMTFLAQVFMKVFNDVINCKGKSSYLWSIT